MRGQGLLRWTGVLGASAVLVALAAGPSAGCILNRSGTQPDRAGLDGSVDSALPLADGSAADSAVADASVPVDCATGSTRDLPCGACGTTTETCEGGSWTPGACVEAPPCEVGAVEMEMEACGNCGTHTRTRTCGGCDGWGAWSAFGVCTAEGDCAPGDVRMTTESCACGAGSRVVSDSCNGSCSWDRSTGPCDQQTCGTLFGDVCPNDRAWRPCPRSLRARQCRCDGNTGDFVDCDDSTC